MKQETLNKVALEFAKDHHEMYETSNFGSMHFGFCWGAKWQQEQQDEFAIEFAEWFNNLKYDIMRYKTMEEHLEIYKKEKGL